ncbi:MAG: hypothetical protein AAB680_04370 [Pseudomonadota bacterium]
MGKVGKFGAICLSAALMSQVAIAMPAGWLTPFLMERGKQSWTARSARITTAINSLYETRNIELFVGNYKDACRGILGEHMAGGIPVWAQTSQSNACQVAEALDKTLISRSRTNIRYCQVLNSAINGLERGKSSSEAPHLQPQLDELHAALLRLKGATLTSEGGVVNTGDDILFLRDRSLRCR